MFRHHWFLVKMTIRSNNIYNESIDLKLTFTMNNLPVNWDRIDVIIMSMRIDSSTFSHRARLMASYLYMSKGSISSTNDCISSDFAWLENQIVKSTTTTGNRSASGTPFATIPFPTAPEGSAFISHIFLIFLSWTCYKLTEERITTSTYSSQKAKKHSLQH